MKIWKLRAEVDEFDNLFPVEEWSYEKMVSFDGRSHIKDWSPERVERMEPEKKLPLSDNPGFYIPDLPAFSKRAVNCLYPMIENYISLQSFCSCNACEGFRHCYNQKSLLRIYETSNHDSIA